MGPLSVRLAAGSVISGLCYYELLLAESTVSGGGMTKSQKGIAGQLFSGAISVVILSAVTIQLFIQIISL